MVLEKLDRDVNIRHTLSSRLISPIDWRLPAGWLPVNLEVASFT